jgi:hypothetical protein
MEYCVGECEELLTGNTTLLIQLYDSSASPVAVVN